MRRLKLHFKVNHTFKPVCCDAVTDAIHPVLDVKPSRPPFRWMTCGNSPVVRPDLLSVRFNLHNTPSPFLPKLQAVSTLNPSLACAATLKMDSGRPSGVRQGTRRRKDLCRNAP